MVEILFGVGFFILMVILFVQSLELPIIMTNGSIGPGFFPVIVTILLIILSVYYLIGLIIKRKKQHDNNDTYVKGEVRRQLIMLIALIVSIFMGQFLGLILTMGILITVTLVIVEKLSWVRSVIFGLSSMVCFYLLFDLWLKVNLPTGVFG